MLQALEAALHDPVLQGVERDHAQPSAGFQAVRQVLQRLLLRGTRYFRAFRAVFHRGLRCVQDTSGVHLHLGRRGGAGVGQGAGSYFEIRGAGILRHVLGFVAGQHHAHGGSSVGAAALGHHVGDRLRDLFVTLAGDEFCTDGVDAAVQDTDGAVLVPGDVFVLHHEAETFVLSFIIGHSSSLRFVFGVLSIPSIEQITFIITYRTRLCLLSNYKAQGIVL